jgi:hypothetical protein
LKSFARVEVNQTLKVLFCFSYIHEGHFLKSPFNHAK